MSSSVNIKSCVALAAAATVLAAPATAEAKARHHRATGSSVQAQLKTAESQIAELQQQLFALQARLDQQAAGNNGGASQAAAPALAAAQQAQATADAAAARADHAVAVADAAKADAGKAGKGADAFKWASNTQISGRAYMNVSTITQHTNGAAGTNTNNANSGTGINIKRLYIGIDHQFSPMFSANFTADISNVIGETANLNYATPSTTVASVKCTVAGATATCPAQTANLSTAALVGKGFYVKKAYLQAKLAPELWVRLGAADLPWVPYVEGQYGLRHIENVMIDRLSYGTSTDWGVHVGGDLANGLISYQVSAIDGGGYRNVKVTKAVDLEGRISAQYKGAYVALGGYTGKRGNDVEVSSTATLPTTFTTAKRYDIAAGYKNKLLGIGAEYFYAKDWNNVTVNPATTALSQDSASGWSVFGNVNVTPKWSVFARYDEAKPNRITDPTLKDHYVNVGLQWEPVKIVDLALVYKHETASNGAVSTSDGVIGCATSATANSFATLAAQTSGICAGNGTYDEIGLFGQLKF